MSRTLYLTDGQMDAVREHFFRQDPRNQYGYPYDAELVSVWRVRADENTINQIQKAYGTDIQ